MTKIVDTIDPKIKFQLMEDSSEVDGVHILAKVKGQFFVPDGVSRNQRFYPKALWEKIINDPKVKQALEKRLMFGTVGHDAELGDKAVREGLVSHFMTKIYIDERNQGIGEAYVMNTPVGKILNTILRAGSQLYVSSRANGSFKGKQDGMPVVDPDAYDLIGWDFVIDPGFLTANPSIAEAYNKIKKDLSEDDNTGDSMPGSNDAHIRLVEHITNENTSLKEKLNKALGEVTTLTANNEELFNENKHLKAESVKLEDLEKYSAIGTVAEVTEALSLAEKLGEELAKFKELGEVSEVKKALEKSLSELKLVREKFGTVEEIETSLSVAEKFHAEVSKIGTVKEIREMVISFSKLMEDLDSQAEDKVATELAAELKLDVEKVKVLLQKLSVEEIRDIYSSLTASVVKEEEEEKKEDEKEDDKKDDDKKTESKESKKSYKKNFNESKKEETEEVKIAESSILGKSRAERMNERFTRV